MKAYLSIDPGHTAGYAFFDEEGQTIEYGQFKQEEITEWLTENLTSDLKMVIIEDYRNHPWMKQKGWGRNETSKMIGKIELMCELRGVKFIKQANTNKAIGYMWAGLGKAPSNHSISHQFDAVAHGVFWLVQNGIRKLGVKDEGLT